MDTRRDSKSKMQQKNTLRLGHNIWRVQGDGTRDLWPVPPPPIRWLRSSGTLFWSGKGSFWWGSAPLTLTPYIRWTRLSEAVTHPVRPPTSHGGGNEHGLSDPPRCPDRE